MVPMVDPWCPWWVTMDPSWVHGGSVLGQWWVYGVLAVNLLCLYG